MQPQKPFDTPSGVAMAGREGKADSAIFYVGHVMVDNALYQAGKLASADTSGFETSAFKAANTGGGKRYGVVTLHRPSNVDSAGMMTRIGGALKEIAAELPLIFPPHPRTRGKLEKFGIDLGPNITLVGPQAYMAFLDLWKDAAVVLTDSGGLQEETTALDCRLARREAESRVCRDRGNDGEWRHCRRGAQGAAWRRQAGPSAASVGWQGGGADCGGAGE